MIREMRQARAREDWATYNGLLESVLQSYRSRNDELSNSEDCLVLIALKEEYASSANLHVLPRHHGVFEHRSPPRIDGRRRAVPAVDRRPLSVQRMRRGGN